VNNSSGDGTGCFEVKVGSDTVKFTNVGITGFRKSRNLVIETKVFIKNKNEDYELNG